MKIFSASLRLCEILFFFILLIGCSRNTDWVQFRGEGGRGASSTRITPPLGLRWKIKLQDNDERIKSLNPPVVMGDTIYFGSDDGNFYALDVDSGYMRWVFKSGANINSIPYADKDYVYFGSQDGKLYALDRRTGEESWNFSTRSQINSLVQRYKDHIIFVGDADAIYFLTPDGREEFRIDNPGWYNYTFLVANDVLYHGTGPRVEFVGPFDINTRQFLWWLPYHEIDARWYSFCAVSGDLLFFGTADVHYGTHLGYYAINRHTGRIVWDRRIEGNFGFWQGSELNTEYSGYVDKEIELFLRNVECLDFLAPAVFKDLVIFTGGDNVARAFDAASGVLRWEVLFDTPISSAPTIAGDRVYFGLLDDYVHPPKLICLSARDGRLLWETELEGAILSAPVIAGKRVIFGTDKSVFYVMEQVF